MKIRFQIKALVAGIVMSSSVVPAAMAEDIEIYNTLGANGTSTNPNIMFIVDTSGSMGTETKVKQSYDASTSYSGSCQRNGIYFVDNGKIPNCATSTDWFNRSALECDHAVVGYTAAGVKITPKQDGALLLIGTYSDQLAQYDSVKNKWRELTIGTSSERNYIVDCLSDSGIHGSGGGAKYIRDSGPYTNIAPADPKVPHPVWSGGSGNLQLFDGNYINYLNDNTVPLVKKSYLDQVKAAVEIMVRGNTRIDIGLMRFDKNAEGGPVIYPILDVGADRNDFFSRLKNLNDSGYTPLSEVYYEALLYFGGKAADYGNKSNPSNQTGSTYTSGGKKYYNSPIASECDKNYIVMLSDGQPRKDDLSHTRQGKLPGFTVGSCSDPNNTSYDNKSPFNSDGATDDNCMDELAGWAFTKDVATDSSIPAHNGDQHITTHTIGFQLADAGAIQLMKDTASKGGGGFYEAKSEAGLIKIFNLIIASALQVNSTFSSPAVSVNAFNRSTHLDDLYFTLFKPGDGNHWDGNLKKYKLEFELDTADKDKDGDKSEYLPFIADQLSTKATPVHAVDEKTGFFADAALSYWSTPVNGKADGKEVGQGGASQQFTTARNVYTYTGNYSASGGVYTPATKALTATSNRMQVSNGNLTDALLATTGFPDIVSGTPYNTTLINWASGRDALSKYGTANTYNDVRPQMGDPLHAEPALVQYGGTAANPDMVAFVATNDGYLHAFDADTGVEEFSFIPQELLPNLSTAMEDLGGPKLYGLDGSVIPWINDVNGDGVISGAGEHVYLYVSMRRGGRNIYALDVTDRTSPRLMWVIKGGTGKYKELGDTWSTINIEKVKDGNAEKTVLMFGGGYDKSQDAASVRAADSVGRTIYIADATTGKRLYSAGKDSSTTPITGMEYSIPARLKPLDISGDGFVDRIYATDMGGRIFRFDINNTNGAALSASITGGMIADLAGSGATNARRFYYPPDVALVDGTDEKYHALVLSSGFRAHPLNTDVHDRIYMLKDRKTGLTTSYSLISNLHDATDNLAGGDGGAGAAGDLVRDAEIAKIQSADGWYIDLEDESNPGTWLGEKGLAEPLIIEGNIILTTYTPNVFASSNSCEPNIGLGKVFFMDIRDATPSFPQNVDKRPQRHITLTRGGIPPSPNVIITKGGRPTLCIGTECQAADFDLGVRKTYWYEVEK